MKIAINLFLTSPKSVTGAFVYIQNILPALFLTGREHTFYLVGESASIDYFKSRYASMPNVRFHVTSTSRDMLRHPTRALRKLLAKVLRDYTARERIVAEEIDALARKENIDAYFSPASLYPRGLSAVRIVTTIHDLQYEYFPNNFPPDYLAERREACRYAVACSTRLIAISEYTKKTLIDKCGADPEKVKVVYHAPREIAGGSACLEMPEEFIFYPAALWPHKNHRVLIKALGLLKSRFPSLCAVCTGMTKGGSLKKNLESLVESEGLHGRVFFLGYVADEDIRALYMQAKALVFPSAFEGFGIPLVEAFYFGLPVIAADNSSIPEVVGDAGLLVKTGDAEALAEAIERTLTDKPLRDALIRKGRERARIFSWEKAARETLAVFESVARAPER